MAIDWKAGEHWSTMFEGADHLIAGEYANKFIYIISGVTAMLDERLHVYTGGMSQYGKSMLQRKMGVLFPKCKEVNSASAKSMYYEAKKTPTCMANGIRLYDEIADQSTELRTQLKGLTSQGTDSVRLSTVDKDRVYIEVVIKGLPVVWMNSVDNVCNEQLTNRFFKTDIDESKKQDERVDEFQVGCSLKGVTPKPTDPTVKAAQQVIRTILKNPNTSVVNPFARHWTVHGARNIRPMINTMVSGIAFINAKDRPLCGGRVVASESDNLLALHLWKKFEVAQETGLPKRLADLFGKMPVSASQSSKMLSSLVKKSETTCRIYANDLESRGFLTSYTQMMDKVKFWTRDPYITRTSVVYGGSDELLAQSLKEGGVHCTVSRICDKEFLDTVYGCTGASMRPPTGTLDIPSVHQKCTGGTQTEFTGDTQIRTEDEE